MINGERIYLRLPELSDLEDIYELANIEMNRDFLNFYRPMSKSDIEEWIKSLTEKANASSGYTFVMVNKKNNRIMGTTGLDKIEKITRIGELGITMKKEFQNKEYGTETLKMLIKWGFETLNLNMIIIPAVSNNERARHVYEHKLKFKYEATLRNRFYKNGKYYGQMFFSMTKEEYEEIYGEKE